MNQTKVVSELLTENTGWIPSGYVWVKAPNRESSIPGDFFIIQLGWIGIKELIALKEFIKQSGFTAFSEGESTPAQANGASATPTIGPVCPTHHKPMRPSQYNGGWFCKCKTLTGFCNVTAEQDLNGQYIYKGN